MASSLSWVDFSEAERRRTQDVLDLLDERDTRDELGIGVVRDAIADLLFPGTSTLHTRARYFLFIPWIYERLADKGASAGDVARRARKAELGLIGPLKEQEDGGGIIGATAEERLKRLPSAMYWAGLATWGIRRFPGSQAQYHRSFERIHGGDGEWDDDAEPTGARRLPWDPELPEAPADFPERVSFALSRAEADYLQHRIQATGPSLLAELVRRGTSIEVAAFPWERSDADSWREELREQVLHARSFSEVMHGASLLYNLLLAEALKDAELIEGYREALARWGALMASRRQNHRAWRRPDFWALVATRQARISLRTRAFADSWLDLALSCPPAFVADRVEAREMVRRREEQLKRGRARLGNPSALARWGGAAGAAQLNYRWSSVQAVSSDVLRGLGAKA